MGDTLISGITAIQAILAPALGISATALLMLSISNRFSLTINRIRLLNEERRRYTIKLADKSDLSYAENIRFSSANAGGNHAVCTFIISHWRKPFYVNRLSEITARIFIFFRDDIGARGNNLFSYRCDALVQSCKDRN
jgi:hypothetical protein